jgi:cysteine-rich repeat protein
MPDWRIAMRMALHVTWICAVGLSACSIDPVTFTAATFTEDCDSVGDEDANGLADCADPLCQSAPACLCGNGTLDLGEQCDDGNANNGDGCSKCLLPRCGDAVVDPDEKCDDGNQQDGDTCDATCRIAAIAYTFSGHFTTETDGNSGQTINFAPIPVGTPFQGCLSYERDAPQTGFIPSQGPLALYYNTPTGRVSITVNGATFATRNADNANPAIQVSPINGFTEITQPITMPTGWAVTFQGGPYLTIRHLIPSVQPGPNDPIPTVLALGASSELVFDFQGQNPVTFPGGSYVGRPFLNGTVETLTPGCSGK